MGKHPGRYFVASAVAVVAFVMTTYGYISFVKDAATWGLTAKTWVGIGISLFLMVCLIAIRNARRDSDRAKAEASAAKREVLDTSKALWDLLKDGIELERLGQGPSCRQREWMRDLQAWLRLVPAKLSEYFGQHEADTFGDSLVRAKQMVGRDDLGSHEDARAVLRHVVEDLRPQVIRLAPPPDSPPTRE